MLQSELTPLSMSSVLEKRIRSPSRENSMTRSRSDPLVFTSDVTVPVATSLTRSSVSSWMNATRSPLERALPQIGAGLGPIRQALGVGAAPQANSRASPLVHEDSRVRRSQTEVIRDPPFYDTAGSPYGAGSRCAHIAGEPAVLLLRRESAASISRRVARLLQVTRVVEGDEQEQRETCELRQVPIQPALDAERHRRPAGSRSPRGRCGPRVRRSGVVVIRPAQLRWAPEESEGIPPPIPPRWPPS